ncbi:hypothetical protein COCC4DRAFT_134470 [Bipolaris maydis ATCC 48331]|uniref:Uncharacterized protein n=2 Tax=Cochliobolus heterostrophus TaxID=5016 RepID=M2SPY1_COCH5|nr:uncharacterized protein COCC4DRAFT_134470 [Bipolaris maydis ATCC 48331]EMD87335.1 hypothetical protein COCHEDRAFT_1113073 [Bipolaris maydis C5]ENI06533.1 hypothetical protein COCC4DRAFT_134470 [Bipolaris maydis ATCC 48331]
MQGVRGKCLALRLETRAQPVKPALPHRLCWTAGRLLSKKIDIVATRSKIPIQICVRDCVHWLAEVQVSSRLTPGIYLHTYVSMYLCTCPSMYTTLLPRPPQSVSLPPLHTTSRARHLFPFEGGMHLHL